MQSSQATKDQALDLLPKRMPVRISTTTIIQTLSQCFGSPRVPHSHEYTERLSLYAMPEKLTIKSFLCPCLSIVDDATAVPASQRRTPTINNMTRLMDAMQDMGGTGPIKKFSS
jgi:hypothetical protein